MKNKGCIIGVGFIAFLIVVSLVLTLTGGSPSSVLQGKVGIVKIEGILGMDVDTFSIIEQVKQYRKDSSIKAMVLRVNSPGGAVAPAQEIYAELKKFREKKSIVASMGTLAASGGYYVSIAANKIVANPGTMTGSIGVIMEIPNVEGLMGKIGIKNEIIKSGRNKDMASMFRGMTKEERELLQALLDDVHDQFIEAVAEGRNMDIDDVRRIADGRVFTGRQAVKLGLVDELGTLEDAILIAARFGGIEGEPEVVYKKRHFSLMDLLRGDINEMFAQLIGRSDMILGMGPKFLFSP